MNYLYNIKTLLNKTKLVLLLFLVLNLVLKYFFLVSIPLDGDEPFSVFFSQVSYSELFEMIKTENNPPLHFILLNIWTKLFGISELSVRFPSYLFSCFTVIYIYLIGSKFFSKQVAISSAVFFTFSSMNMLFSHEARVYAIFGFLTAATFYYFLICLSNKNKFNSFVKLILCNSFIIFAHFFGFFVIFIQVIVLAILYYNKIAKTKKFIYSYLSVLIIYSPYLVIFIQRFFQSASKGTWISPPNDISALYFMLWKFCNAPAITVLLIVIMLFALFLFLFKQKNKQINFQTITVLVWSLFPFFFMYAISYKVPMYLDRYLVYVSIGFYLLFSISIHYLTKTLQYKYINILTWTTLFLYCISLNPLIEKDKRKSKEYALKIKEIKSMNPNTVVIISPNYAFRTLSYYYNKSYFTDYKNSVKLLNNEIIFPVNSINEVPPSLLKNNPDIVFIDNWAAIVDSNLTIEKYINQLNGNTKIYKFGDVKLTHFTKNTLILPSN